MLSLAGRLDLAVDDAVDALLTYPAFTLQHYDLGPSSGDNRIGPAEIGRLIVIEPLPQQVALSLLAASSDASWWLVPNDTRIEDADPEGQVYWDAARLFAHFDDLPYVGTAITSKLLHLKRPGFFPILDSIVRDLYDDAARYAYDSSPRAQSERPNECRLYWAAIREDLRLDGNREALRMIRSRLSSGKPTMGTQLASLSAVRLIDMIVWQRCH